MVLQLFITGFVLGVASSVHCVGMCGPIAFSLPVYYLPPAQKATGIFLYNFGRITTYALLGLLFGFAGRQIYLGGLQQGFSIIMGSILLIFFIAARMHKTVFRFRRSGAITIKLQSFIARYMQQKKRSGMYILGLANGLLPCGMVYFAITGALAAGTVNGGILFMSAFGAGTFPAMFALSFFGSLISLPVRNQMKKAVPFVMLAMGLLLVFRGLHLNIPYLSPYLQASNPDAVSCH